MGPGCAIADVHMDGLTTIWSGAQKPHALRAGLADMLALVPHAQTVDVQAAGHMVAGDDNDIFAERLEHFLDQIDPDG